MTHQEIWSTQLKRPTIKKLREDTFYKYMVLFAYWFLRSERYSASHAKKQLVKSIDFLWDTRWADREALKALCFDDKRLTLPAKSLYKLNRQMQRNPFTAYVNTMGAITKVVLHGAARVLEAKPS